MSDEVERERIRIKLPVPTRTLSILCDAISDAFSNAVVVVDEPDKSVMVIEIDKPRWDIEDDEEAADARDAASPPPPGEPL